MPVSRVAEFVRAASQACEAAMPGARPLPFGHFGDGNIHFNVAQPVGMDKDAFLSKWRVFNRIVHDIVEGLDGSISAEHGIGLIKRDLPDSPVRITPFLEDVAALAAAGAAIIAVDATDRPRPVPVRS